MVRLNPDSPLARDEGPACAAAGAIVRDMAARAGGRGFIVHPYPVTPFHGAPKDALADEKVMKALRG